jgi:hypothetical protein
MALTRLGPGKRRRCGVDLPPAVEAHYTLTSPSDLPDFLIRLLIRSPVECYSETWYTWGQMPGWNREWLALCPLL